MSVILRYQLAMHNKQMLKSLYVSLSKFCQLGFCHILFELVYNWEKSSQK